MKPASAAVVVAVAGVIARKAAKVGTLALVMQALTRPWLRLPPRPATPPVPLPLRPRCRVKCVPPSSMTAPRPKRTKPATKVAAAVVVAVVTRPKVKPVPMVPSRHRWFRTP